jgi:hypothetical protein
LSSTAYLRKLPGACLGVTRRSGTPGQAGLLRMVLENDGQVDEMAFHMIYRTCVDAQAEAPHSAHTA